MNEYYTTKSTKTATEKSNNEAHKKVLSFFRIEKPPALLKCRRKTVRLFKSERMKAAPLILPKRFLYNLRRIQNNLLNISIVNTC